MANLERGAAAAADAAREVATDRGRVLVGVMGGFAALLVRYLSQHHSTVLEWARENLPLTALKPMLLDYSIVIPIVLILGGIVAWLSEERNRLKLFALGVSAPALVTTYAGDKLSMKIAEAFTPPSAVAQTLADADSLNKLLSSDGERVYAIHLASFQAADKAQQVVDRLNQLNTVRAFSKDFMREGVQYHRVLITQMLPLKDAFGFRERVVRSSLPRTIGINPNEVALVDVTK